MKKTKIAKIIGNVLFYGLMVLVLTVCGSYMYQKKAHPERPASILGVTPLRVSSGSMEPKFPVGTIVFVKAEDHYEKGDIISFHASFADMVVTHRVDRRWDTNLYSTKGDNNNAVDPEETSYEQIIGKVFFYLPLTTAGLIQWSILLTCFIAGFSLGLQKLRKKRTKLAHIQH